MICSMNQNIQKVKKMICWLLNSTTLNFFKCKHPWHHPPTNPLHRIPQESKDCIRIIEQTSQFIFFSFAFITKQNAFHVRVPLESPSCSRSQRDICNLNIDQLASPGSLFGFAYNLWLLLLLFPLSNCWLIDRRKMQIDHFFIAPLSIYRFFFPCVPSDDKSRGRKQIQK